MILIILCIAMFFVFIAYSSICIPVAAESLSRCLRIVIPSIFPFMVLAEILSKTKFSDIIKNKSDLISRKLFKISGNAFFIVFLGYLCGFPGAARLTANLYDKKRISYEDSIRISVFSNNPGPLFIIGTIGFGLLKSVSLGILLFIIQLLASLLTGLILNRFIKIQSINSNKIHNQLQETVPALKNITESIASCFSAMIPITGTIVFFSFFSEAIISSGILLPVIKMTNIGTPLFESLFRTFFELSGGLSSTIPLIESKKTLFILVSGMCSWSGVSIHMQILNFYINSKIEIKYYFIGKLFTILITIIISMFVTMKM